jgi:hypothetical protein
MQTLNIDGTSYKVKFDRDPVELAKAARKPYKQKKPKDIRKFPVVGAGVTSTAEYVRRFEDLNYLVPGDYFPRLNVIKTAQYDPSIPLLEDLSNDTTN